MNSYRTDSKKAAARFESHPGQSLQTRQGAVEYAEIGEGPDVLFSHGVLGSYLDGVDSVDMWIGRDVHAVVPSRFGYFGSTLPANPTVGDQAAAYVELLDHLEISDVVAIGFSAGGPSVIELALRYPQRVSGLVLCSSRLPSLPKPKGWMKPLLHFVFGADRLFWVYKQLMPKTYALMVGIPKTYEITESDHLLFDEIADSFFPLKPRQQGAVFDSFTSNPAVDDAPLEDIAVPALIIHSQDDPLAPYYSAREAARRIPQARLITLPSGGHLFLGHDSDVRCEIHRFLREVVPEELTHTSASAAR